QPYQILVQPAVSTDPHYSGRDGADVSATNSDNDVAGITVTPVAGLVTTEAGGTATFTVRLTSQPDADVAIPVASNDASRAAASPGSLRFTAADWNVPQTVTVTGVNDFVVDGDIGYGIVTSPATSTDVHYSGMDAADVAVTNQDDDVAGFTVSPLAGLTTTEA